MGTRTADHRDLLATIDQLAPMGWGYKETKSGVVIHAPDKRGTVCLHASGASSRRTLANTIADLRALGYDEDQAQLADQRERNRQVRLAADKVKQVPPDVLFTAPDDPLTGMAAADFPSLGSDAVPRPSEVRGMQTRTETISPARARALLERPFTATLEDGTQLRQRPVKDGRVGYFRDLILRGGWRLMPDGLSVAPDGSLLNGQHRLKGVVAAGKAADFRVTYNVPPELFADMDTGLNRTAGDVLYSAGLGGNSAQLASTGKLVLCYERWRAGDPDMPTWVGWSRFKLTHRELLSGISSYPDLAEHIRAAQNVSRRANLLIASLGAFLQIASDECRETGWEEGRELLTDFVVDLRPDRADHILPPGNPALTLRNWALGADPRQLRPVRREALLLLLLRHWNAYASGKSIKLVMFDQKRAAMPEPYSPGNTTRRGRTRVAA